MGASGSEASEGITESAGGFWTLLDANERRVVRRSGVVRRFSANEYLCQQGDARSHVFILLSGHVEIAADASAGFPSILAVRGQGDIVGELTAIDRTVRSATVRALDTVEAIVVSADRFAALCLSRTRIAWAVLQVVVRRLRELSHRRVEHSGTTVGDRVVALLTELTERYGVKSGNGVMISVPLSQQRMASMVSASRESVVRTLRTLRDQGIIVTRRRHVTVLRPDQLKWPRS